MATHIQLANIIESYFPPGSNLTFVEVGAAHPVHISVSFALRPLEEQKRLFRVYFGHEWDGREPVCKWDITSIEPNPDFVDEFHKCNLPILPYAISDVNNDGVPFTIYTSAPMCFSALIVRYSNPHAQEKFHQVQVQTKRLDSLITQTDVLLIDTEGYELEVLQSMGSIRPQLIVVELAGSFTAVPTEKYLVDLGYRKDRCAEYDGFFVLK